MSDEMVLGLSELSALRTLIQLGPDTTAEDMSNALGASRDSSYHRMYMLMLKGAATKDIWRPPGGGKLTRGRPKVCFTVTQAGIDHWRLLVETRGFPPVDRVVPDEEEEQWRSPGD